MDTTKDIVDEEENNVDVATEQPNVNNNNTSNTSSGLQQIDDNNDLPLSMGAAEVISNTAEPPKQIGKVEQIDDDNYGPEPPAAMLEVSLNAAEKSNEMMRSSLESIDDDLMPPTPFDSTNFEQDDTIAKKKAKDEIMNQKPSAVSTDLDRDLSMPSSGRNSIYEPPREVIEAEEGISDNTNTGRGDTDRRGWEDIESRVARRDIESQTRTDDNDTLGSINDAIVDTEANIEPTFTNQVLTQGLPEVEAYLVEDVEEEVYIATPTLPWWKQKRARIFFGVVIVLVGTLAIALGVSLSQSNNPETISANSTILFVTPPPTISIAPSLSIAPSPTRVYECFGADDGGVGGVLYGAVRAYVKQDCANNKDCLIGQIYGWPMNSWCVGNVISMSDLFYEMDTFNEVISGWNTSSVTNMRYMFGSASSFNQDLLWNTSNVTDMSYMFSGASLFNGDLSNFDTWSVTNMQGMFSYASAFNGDLSNFDTSRVIDMTGMFFEATSFNGDVSNFDTSRVTDIGGMFKGASSFNQDLSNFDTSSVTDMQGMFFEATSFNGDVSNFNTSSVTDMSLMFFEATSFNGDISNFDTSRVIDMTSMFFEATSFNGDVSNFDTSRVTNMTGMFSEATSFNGDVSNFDTSSVTSMYGMFEEAASFNQDVSNFDTSSVTKMQYMFYGATSFNGDVSNFDTSRVTNMTAMFAYASSFNRDLINFDTLSVTEMAYMFGGANSFNGDLSNFDTSSVTDMYSMFWGATAFNQDLSNFNTSSVTDMGWMFGTATSFNKDVSSFDTSRVTSMSWMFYNATSFNKDLCSWRDRFPYTDADDIFLDSNCTYQDTPNATQKGPFCASYCQ